MAYSYSLQHDDMIVIGEPPSLENRALTTHVQIRFLHFSETLPAMTGRVSGLQIF